MADKAAQGTDSSELQADLSEQRAELERHASSQKLSEVFIKEDLNPAALFPATNVPQMHPLLLLYLPFGLAIASVRILTWVALLLVDKAWLTDNDTSIAVLQFLLGVDVRWQNADLIPEERHVLVSNHVTTGDMMMLYKLPRKIEHLVSTSLPQRITQTKHHRIIFKHASVASYDELARSGRDNSVHLFPEGGMTNGKGMMKFNKGFLRFADDLPVVPVALRASTPWNISTHTLHSSFLSNLFWFCFSPYVSLHLTVLSPLRRAEDESKAQFVERTQQKIAEELQIPIHDFTIQAKRKLMQESKPRA